MEISSSNHINYHCHENILYDGIVSLLNNALEITGKQMDEFSIVELGCGRGELLGKILNEGYTDITGVDFDENCLAMCRDITQGKVKLIKGDIDGVNLLSEQYDVFIMSHLIEHLSAPLDVLKMLIGLNPRFIILSVPNLQSPRLIFLNWFTDTISALRGHVYGWDRSHFVRLLETHLDLKIEKWYYDRVSIVSSRSFLREKRFSNMIISFMENNLLPRLFPRMSESLTVLSRVK